MESLFAESNRLAAVFGGVFADKVDNEYEMTLPLDPRVSFEDIVDALGDEEDGTAALWLDRECLLVDARYFPVLYNHRYQIVVSPKLGNHFVTRRTFFLFQVAGTTARGAPLPALEFLIKLLTNEERVELLLIAPNLRDEDETKALDVSPVCFANMLQTSRRLHDAKFSVNLYHLSLTAEQTALLFTHDAGPVCINLLHCRFHGPTLLQFDPTALLLEQTHLIGGGSYLAIEFAEEAIYSTSVGELRALLSNPHLRCFSPFLHVYSSSYGYVRKLVSALAANKISRLERLDLSAWRANIEWEREEEPSAWVDFWNAVGHHPSLKEIHLREHRGLSRQKWWEPIAAAVKVNPRLVHVGVKYGIHGSDSDDVSDSDDASDSDDTGDRAWKTLLAKHAEPLLERNRYRPKIAALLCGTDPSKVAALLVQAIVAVRNKNASVEIHQMLVEQLVAFDVGGVGRVLGKRPLADTIVVVPNDALATKTEPRVADSIAASTSDNNESKL